MAQGVRIAMNKRIDKWREGWWWWTNQEAKRERVPAVWDALQQRLPYGVWARL
jgi:hypothetical protein